MSLSELPKIVVICGPTGVGKTSFAIELAKRFGGRIVGADAMQIYRQMDIGTAKPTAEEQAAVRHYMVDIIPPDAPYDAAVYGEQAHQIVEQLMAQKNQPFVVGGTGLYIKALVYGLFEQKASDPILRHQLKQQLKEQGAESMHHQLAFRDPEASRRIHPNDSFRILRALEVIAVTGRPLSDHHKAHGFQSARYQTLTIGLHLPREQLYDRINLRVDLMIAQGLLEEVQGLLAQGVDPGLKSMQALGYRHMVDFIQGKLPWDEAVRTLKRDHRRYAKRQFTWFNRIEDIHWLTPEQLSAAEAMVKQFIGV